MSLEAIGKYEVVSTLGRGSMGVVYKARDPEIGRLVAIKTLRSVYLGENNSENEAMQRFRQESRSAGRLHHPNIVTIFEAGRAENGSPYIVMEYIEGKSLDTLIAEQTNIPIRQLLHYLAQVANAIDYAHSQNVIHRDIKPSNILIDSQLKPHLLDFGVAKLNDTSLTPSGTVVGTPSYMSPEQIKGETLDGSTDRFAFAVVAFESLTGVRPFPGKDFTTVVSNIINKEPLTFAELGCELPPDLEKILVKALAKDPSSRYSSALEFVDAIASQFSIVVDGTGVVGGPTGLPLNTNIANGVTPIVSSSIDSQNIIEVSTNKEEGLLKENSQIESKGNTEGETDPTEDTIAKKPNYGEMPENYIADGSFGLKKFIVGAAVLLIFFGIGFYFISQQKEEISHETRLFQHQGTDTTILDEVSEDEQNTNSVKQNLSPTLIPIKPKFRDKELTQAVIKELGDAEIAFLLSSKTSDPGLVLSEAALRSNPLLVSFVIPYTHDENFKVRIEALKCLSSDVFINTDLGFKAVIDLLTDSEFLVRGYAVKTLALSTNPQVLELLEQRYKVEEHEVVIKVLRQAIAQVKAAAINRQ